MHIGKFIKQYRKDNNLSMAEFAEKSGISKAYVSVLEKNKDPRNGKEIIPSIPTIKKISSAINISFDDILNALNEEQIISLDETELEKSSNSLPVTENETLPSTLQKITDASSKLEHKRQLVVLNTAE
ncbi:XRE family transcriptional regulator, partial [Streptococcus minor]